MIFEFKYSYKSTESKSLTGISNSQIVGRVVADSPEDALLPIYELIKSWKNIKRGIIKEPTSLEIKLGKT